MVNLNIIIHQFSTSGFRKIDCLIKDMKSVFDASFQGIGLNVSFKKEVNSFFKRL